MSEFLPEGYVARPPAVERGFLHDQEWQNVYSRLAQYDPNSPETEHLRPRQSVAVSAFCLQGSEMLSGAIPLQGMSVIHPTGSGKTVLASEVIRTVAEGRDGHNVLMLVPSLQILNQAAGDRGKMGEINSRVPDISVGKYTGDTKTTDNRVTIMNYHMLRSAIARGDIAKINPKLIIADEIHHIIDGTWAEDVKEVAGGVLTLGLTATPAYSQNRDARELFPVVLDHMTMKEGIQSGILSDLKCFTYEGSARITVQNSQGEMNDADIFQGVANSKDNYLAAAICAAEVSQGRRGIVSCVPGLDRLHAKMIAKILSQTRVNTPQGSRPINAAHIDGSMEPDEIHEILTAYHKDKAEIDVISFVGLLLEGWNSPQTDFGVWLRPTPSRVLAEQRIGRLLRRRGGKVARLHEVIYQVEGTTQQQVTHKDVLNDVQVSKYGVKRPNVNNIGRVASSRSFKMPELVLSADASDLIQQNLKPVDEETLQSEREPIPYEWPTLFVLAKKFNLELSDAEAILQANGAPSVQENENGHTRTFYSPESDRLLAEHLGVTIGVPETHMTISDLVEYCRHSDIARVVTPKALRKHLQSKGFKSEKCLLDNTVTTIYPEEVCEALVGVEGTAAPKSRKRTRERNTVQPHVDIVNWLSTILVNPKEATTPLMKKHLVIAQSSLVRALSDSKAAPVRDADMLRAEVAKLNIEPSDQMQNVMRAKNIDFITLLLVASRAKDDWVRTISR